MVCFSFLCFFFKQKTAYEMRISDWSSDVCSSDLEAYGKVTQLQPREVKAWNGLGGMYLAAGRRDDAEAAFRHALRIAPSYGVLSNLGTIQYEAGRYAEAARMYRQAAELKPEDYRHWGQLGDEREATGGNGEREST